MGNTGYKSFASLELYYTDDNSYAGTTKPNVSTDPDYIAPVLDTATCVPSVKYYNTVRTLNATKNDCSSGYTGSTVTLTANANQFVSTMSVDDANAQADSWLAANVQAYANSLGTCELVNDTTAPTAPTLSYSSVTATTLNLSWTSSTDNIGVTGYDIYKNGVLLDSTVSTILTYHVTGLSDATTYSFYVKAKDAAENSTISNTLNITTPSSTSGTSYSYTILETNSNDATGGCAFVNVDTPNETVYSSDAYLIVGSHLYSNSGLTLQHSGSSHYYQYTGVEEDHLILKINSTGIITEIINCNTTWE